MEKKLNEVIDILNNKGYLVDIYSCINKESLIKISDLVNDLINNNKIFIDNNTISIIEKYCSDEIIIIFKENYNFKKIPNSFKTIDNHLFCEISILKNKDKLECKSLNELEKECNNMINLLKEWSSNL